MAALKNPNEWFAAGRIKACHLMPYFSSAVMGLVPYAVEGFGTLGVSARAVLIWDPELSKKWTVEQLAWVLLHEVGHYLREHAARRERAAADPLLWNLAGDAEINDDLIAAGAKFPLMDEVDKDGVRQVSGITPSSIGCKDGRLCEEYYEHLRKQASSAGGKKKGAGGGKGKGEGPPDPSLPTAGGKGCGSGAGRDPNDAELGVPAELGKSSAEVKRVQREVAEAIRKEASKGRGNLPMGLKRWAEEMLGPPHVPWQQKLARLVRNAVAFRPGAGDYRYDRPSRRQGAFGYGTGSPVFPAMRMPVPQVAIIVDTSGSMGSDELKVALEECKGILSAVGAAISFIACDAAVHSARKVRNIKEAMTLMAGGGGTDMKPAIAQALAERPRPEVLVIVTDGHIGDAGPPPPGMNVVWVVAGSGANQKPAAWGEIVVVDAPSSAAA